MNVSELKAGREARIKENGIKGELYYCERCDRWFVLHNGNAIGNTPLDWDFIKKDKGYKNSWQISDPGSKTTNYVVVMQSNAVCMEYKFGDALPASMHNRHAKIENDGLTTNGVLLYQDSQFYFLSSDRNFDGLEPNNWHNIQKEYDVKYSWHIQYPGGSLVSLAKLYVDDRTFSPKEIKEVEPKIEPPKKILNTGDSLSQIQHQLTKVILREKEFCESSGFLFCSNTGSWFFLSAENKFGGTMPNELSTLREIYDIRGGWQVTSNSSAVLTLSEYMEIELVGGAAEKKHPNVLNPGDVLNPDLHLRYAKLKTPHTTAEGIIYYCPGNKFYVFISNHKDFKGGGGPEGWGHIINSCYYKNVYSLTSSGHNWLCIPNDMTLELVKGHYDLIIKPKKGEKPPVAAHSHSRDFKEGDRVRCLSFDEMVKKFGKADFHHGGDNHLYCGTTGVVKKIISDKAVEVRWHRNGIEYTMLKEELHWEPVLDCSMETSTAKLYIRGLEPPTSTDSFHLREKSELDKIPSGELDTFSPNKISTDSDVKGSPVPMNKDMENLILLGL